MMLRRLVVGGSLVVVGVVGLSGCGGEKPSGIAPFTPGVTGTASPTTSSKWTAEQQQVIDTTATYQALTSTYARGTKLDMSALRGVMAEPFAVEVGKNIADSLDLGFIEHGPADVHEIRAVTITGATSVLTECWIGRSFGVNKKLSPHVTTKPVPTTIVRLNLIRFADKWHVSGSTDGAACTKGQG